MKKQEKTKHHYVPEVYMKGFLPSGENELFVLRKRYGTIHKKHPAQIMYDKNLYTIMFQNERSQMIEDFYSEVENRLPGAFEIMDFLVENPKEYIEAEKNIEFNLLIKSIIALQFWRTPSQNKLAEKYADKILMLYDSSSDQTKKAIDHDRKFVKYLYKHRLEKTHLTIIKNILLPLLTFNIMDETLMEFSFYIEESNKGFTLTSDNPVIFENEDDLFNFKSFAFPLTKNIIISSYSRLDEIDAKNFNKKVFNQAKERIISSNIEPLNKYKSICE